jgi:hypothetical protein
MSGECDDCGEHTIDCQCHYRKDPAKAAEDAAGRLRAKVVADILAERRRQDLKWGVQKHKPAVWALILMEEVGEAADDAATPVWKWDDHLHEVLQRVGKSGFECKKTLDTRNIRAFDHGLPDLSPEVAARYRAELIQVAAVALAAVECLDRQGGNPS